jgi:acetyl esterase
MGRQHILEPAAQEIADATSRLPPVDELGPDGLRKALNDIQAAPIAAPEVDERWITVAAEVGEVRVRIVKPVGSAAPLPCVCISTAAVGSAATRPLTTGWFASWLSA